MAIYDTWQRLQAPTLEADGRISASMHPPSCQQSNLLKYKVSHGEQSTKETDEDDVSSMSNGACGRATKGRRVRAANMMMIQTHPRRTWCHCMRT